MLGISRLQYTLEEERRLFEKSLSKMEEKYQLSETERQNDKKLGKQSRRELEVDLKLIIISINNTGKGFNVDVDWYNNVCGHCIRVKSYQ